MVYFIRCDVEFVFPLKGISDSYFSISSGKRWYWEDCIWSFNNAEIPRDSSFISLSGTFECNDLLVKRVIMPNDGMKGRFFINSDSESDRHIILNKLHLESYTMNFNESLFSLNTINNEDENELINCIFENIIINNQPMISPSTSKKLTLKSCIFINFTRNFIEASGIKIDLINCKFKGFHSEISMSADGGVIYVNKSSVIKVDGCLFEDCYGGVGGSLRFKDSNGEVKNTQFIDSCHGIWGGVLCISGDPQSLFLENILCYGAYSTDRSGVGRLESSSRIIDSTFIYCHAIIAGCFEVNKPLNVESCIFRDCYCDSGTSDSNDGGGCFVCWGSGDLYFTSCIFERCHQEGGNNIPIGGVIRMDGRGFNISECIFSECMAKRKGGAI
jgi:hypothetical protein